MQGWTNTRQRKENGELEKREGTDRLGDRKHPTVREIVIEVLSRSEDENGPGPEWLGEECDETDNKC